MKRFIEGADRADTLFPECVEDWIGEDNQFASLMFLSTNSIWPILGSAGSIPRQPADRRTTPSILLKLYIYGYQNQVQSSRRLEREARPLSLRKSAIVL